MSKDEIRKLLECEECKKLIHACYILTLTNHLLLDHKMTMKEAGVRTTGIYKILGQRKQHYKSLQEAV
jgi:hypothetical protein